MEDTQIVTSSKICTEDAYPSPTEVFRIQACPACEHVNNIGNMLQSSMKDNFIICEACSIANYKPRQIDIHLSLQPDLIKGPLGNIHQLIYTNISISAWPLS